MVATKYNEPVIAGPFSLYEDSFILEFLQPDPSRAATVLMRTTYPCAHPLNKLGKKHPWSPPLHLHFSQSESFEVLAGCIGSTETYALVDREWTPKDGPQELKPWVPHTFWPSRAATEDTVILLWAHPEPAVGAMDRVFFMNLLNYVSDVHEKKASLDVPQLMLMQHVTETAMVWFPKATFLGGLRWWLPWTMQAGFAKIALWQGKGPVMEKYTPAEDWAMVVRGKND